MLKKFIIGAVAAGAVSVPLAGIASADQPSNPGPNNNSGPQAGFNGPPGAAFSQIAKN